MTFTQSLKKSLASAEAFDLMDMLSAGYDAYGESAAGTLTLNTIVAIPDIYANSTLLKQDPARAYGSAADNFVVGNNGRLNLNI